MSEIDLDMLRRLAGQLAAQEGERGADPDSRRGNDPETLREAYLRLREVHRFTPGDLVRWKPLLRNKKAPGTDEPVIVMEVLDTPVLDSEQDAGTPYFREPLDILVGQIDEDNDFVLWHLDSRRLEPFQEGAGGDE